MCQDLGAGGYRSEQIDERQRQMKDTYVMKPYIVMTTNKKVDQDRK